MKKDDWKEDSRKEVDKVVSLNNYKRQKYKAGLSEENKKELEKARKTIAQDKDYSGNEGGE